MAGAIGAPLADLVEGIAWTPGEAQRGRFEPPAELPCRHG
jgi:hypothetical protein